MFTDELLYESRGRVRVRAGGVAHRSDEYDEAGFDVLLRMQHQHFWYRGRHRFLLAALKRALVARGLSAAALSAVDLGAGCGGWVDTLCRAGPRFRELAFVDSSPKAAALAAKMLEPDVSLFQADLLDLGWRKRWDVAFLLDVVEHAPDDTAILREVRETLTDDGLLFVTVPALDIFWSGNDVLASHRRRYTKLGLTTLGEACGLRLEVARYFMFFLSPLLFSSRLFGQKAVGLSPEETRRAIERTHRVPPALVNRPLEFIFSLETPLGLVFSFPWGTSLLAVFRRV